MCNTKHLSPIWNIRFSSLVSSTNLYSGDKDVKYTINATSEKILYEAEFFSTTPHFFSLSLYFYYHLIFIAVDCSVPIPSYPSRVPNHAPYPFSCFCACSNRDKGVRDRKKHTQARSRRQGNKHGRKSPDRHEGKHQELLNKEQVLRKGATSW